MVFRKFLKKYSAFGGDKDLCGINRMKSAEVYDLVQNTWKNLPDMPEACAYVTCVRV